jgi:hypothetical protein
MKQERRKEVRRRKREVVGERRRKRWIYVVPGLCVLCFRVRRACPRGSLGGGTSSSYHGREDTERGGGGEGGKRKTHMFTELIIIRILHLVKVVFIQLPYKRRKV